LQAGSENPLWTFSLVVYAEQGVQEECLALQERFALDVNLLLLCAYAGVQGVMLSGNDVAAAAEAVAGWHAQVVRPLRQARRALKPVARDDAAALRTQVKGIELRAEQIEQAMLWSWWQERPVGTPAEPDAALTANVRRLLEHYGAGGADPAKAAPNLLRTALRYTAKT
jgi:uncharacterized protein (TIGR02444 family)